MVFHIRSAEPDDIEQLSAVHIASWRSTYAGIVPAEHLASLNQQERAERWRAIIGSGRELHLFVAVNGEGMLVGFASCGPELRGELEDTGELSALYLLHEYQGMGLGRKLLEQAAACLRGRYQKMIVWVLSDNRACGFYERLGGVPYTEKTCEIGGAVLPERSYLFTL